MTRYEIDDNFMKFWFRYFYRNQSILEIRNYPLLRSIIRDDYPTFSGGMLERYFRMKLGESGEYRSIGSWWERKRGREASEIDVIAISADDKWAMVGEVKRQRRNYEHGEFMAKVERVKAAALARYEVLPRLFTLEDM
ncbi:MAG: DUF234 domain-containing protein [Bacteroidales bacterium]|nr:DUF234 domain-containing protein [Bacteroidales bacterium]